MKTILISKNDLDLMNINDKLMIMYKVISKTFINGNIYLIINCDY